MGNRVTCYRNDAGDILIVPRAEHPLGFGVAINHVERVDAQRSDAELGTMVHDIQQWCDYKYFDRTAGTPAVTASGEEPGEFYKHWHMINVQFDDKVTLVPTSRGSGTRFWHLVQEAIGVPLDAPAEVLGAAVRLAFDTCREGDVPLN